jgi:hypothetical protein
MTFPLGGCPRNAFDSLSRRDRGFSEAINLSHDIALERQTQFVSRS